MRLVCDPVYGEVDLTASAEELNRLASAVATTGVIAPPIIPPSW
ncbi:MAG: hypothetical protein JWR24_4144 [Actinoallomurus sp.]|nr:hypothetical protein [Actinoallomurus sp.]